VRLVGAVLSFALVAFGALAILAVSAVSLAGNAVKDVARKQVSTAAQASAVAVQQELSGLSEIVNAYATRPTLPAALGASNGGKVDQLLLYAHLTALLRTRSDINQAFIADPSGKLLDIVPSTPGVVGKSFAARDWYRGEVAAHGPYLSSVYATAANGHALVVAAVAPVHAQGSNKVIGILGVSYRLDTIQEYVDHFASAQGVSVTVTDRDGTEVASPGTKLTSVRSIRSDAEVASALAGHSTNATRSTPAGKAITSAVPIHQYGWALVAQTPLHVALARISGLRRAVDVTAGVLGAIVALGLAALLFSARRQRRTEVELRANQATLHASERRLTDARNAATEANHAKSEFLSRMSHELRTPLNSILGFAQLLQIEELDEEQLDNVHQIGKAGRHLLNLINEVLDISRIEAGRLAVSIEPVQVDDVIAEAIDLIRPLASERDIAVYCGKLTDGLFVRGDRHRLRQILVNLLANAVKYNRDRGSVEVRCSEHDGRVRISITDSGAGISPEKQELLFLPFERLGAEQTDVEGTGLGLALSSRLVQALDGRIGVESRAGAGSTFWVEFVVVEAPVEETRPMMPERVIAAGANHTTCTVLYIEDNPANIKLVRRILARRPNVVLLAEREGRAGLAVAGRVHPDLILLDLNLPDIGGEVVLQRLRAEPTTRSIPVIVISADATPGQVGRLKASGAQDYMTKPFDIDALLAAVDAVVPVAT
jgi:signal transduction histidine kinase/ActR/RegA family two-component response regulator